MAITGGTGRGDIEQVYTLVDDVTPKLKKIEDRTDRTGKNMGRSANKANEGFAKLSKQIITLGAAIRILGPAIRDSEIGQFFGSLTSLGQMTLKGLLDVVVDLDSATRSMNVDKLDMQIQGLSKARGALSSFLVAFREEGELLHRSIDYWDIYRKMVREPFEAELAFLARVQKKWEEVNATRTEVVTRPALRDKALDDAIKTAQLYGVEIKNADAFTRVFTKSHEDLEKQLRIEAATTQFTMQVMRDAIDQGLDPRMAEQFAAAMAKAFRSASDIDTKPIDEFAKHMADLVELWDEAEKKVETLPSSFDRGWEAGIRMIRTQEEFATALSSTLQDTLNLLSEAIIEGRAFEDVLKSILKSIASMFFNQGSGVVSSLIGNLFKSGSAAAVASAHGNAISGSGHVEHLARGGVLTGPTSFRRGGRSFEAGERGLELFAPVKRMSNGDVGIRMDGAPRGDSITVAPVFQIGFIDAAGAAEFFRRYGNDMADLIAEKIGRRAELRRQVRSA